MFPILIHFATGLLSFRFRFALGRNCLNFYSENGVGKKSEWKSRSDKSWCETNLCNFETNASFTLNSSVGSIFMSFCFFALLGFISTSNRCVAFPMDNDCMARSNSFSGIPVSCWMSSYDKHSRLLNSIRMHICAKRHFCTFELCVTSKYYLLDTLTLAKCVFSSLSAHQAYLSLNWVRLPCHIRYSYCHRTRHWCTPFLVQWNDSVLAQTIQIDRFVDSPICGCNVNCRPECFAR